MGIYKAATSKQKNLGFQYRARLDPDEAMFFENVGPGSGFHMKNTFTKIAIAGLDEDGKVTDVGEMEPEKGAYAISHKAIHALEASPEFFEKYKIEAGKNLAPLLDSAGFVDYDWGAYAQLADLFDWSE